MFNSLTGYSDKRDYQTLPFASVTLRERIAGMIEREAEHARRGLVRDGALGVELADTVNARQLLPDGTYTRLRPSPVSCVKLR